ncbi:unnamed protein product [Cladocopium goreaui]|uniref:TOG domain-containing protein n=1 Tax=Cladocopium goreaui TaxID=2562237 RepID=A0A9P1DT50_9DINO|nr:unnamed protein product [Cladocopium goreaui]
MVAVSDVFSISDLVAVEDHLLDWLGVSELLPCRPASASLRRCAQQPLARQLLQRLQGGAAQGAALRGLGCVLEGSVATQRFAAQLAVGFLGDTKASMRQSAASVLNRLGDVELDVGASVWSTLGPALSDVDPKVSAAAAKVLTRMAPKHEAAVAVVRQLQHSSPQVRRASLQVLGQLQVKSKALVRRVIEMLLDNDWQVRAMAARTLPRLVERGQNVAAADALEAALEDLHPVVRQNAAGALAHVAANPSLPFVMKAQNAKLKRKAEVLRSTPRRAQG